MAAEIPSISLTLLFTLYSFSFETASLPYDDEHPSLSIEDEDISIEDEDIRISELSIPKQFKTSSRASTSGFSSNLIKHHVQSRDAIEVRPTNINARHTFNSLICFIFFEVLCSFR